MSHMCHIRGFTDLMERVISVFLFSRGTDGRPSSFSLCEDKESQFQYKNLHIIYEEGQLVKVTSAGTSELQKHLNKPVTKTFFQLYTFSFNLICSSDLSLRCRMICTRHSAESLPTSGPLSLTRVECSQSPESSDWNIWSCSWCQT